MLRNDFKDSLRYDPLKSLPSFLFILVVPGSYPMCSANLKFSYHNTIFFCAALYAGERSAWVRRFFEQGGLNMFPECLKDL